MVTPYPLNPEQYASVSSLPAPKRYQHFIGRVADWQYIWGLKDESGWVSAADDSGNPTFLVWPHPDYAAACATGSWSGNRPAPIEVHEFVDVWLPGMTQDGVAVAVFPTATMRGVVVPASQLRQAIQDELSSLG